MFKYVWLLVMALPCAGCSGPAVIDSAESAEVPEHTIASIEDVKLYDHCLVRGISTSTIDLGGVGVYPFPPTREMFRVAECIIGDNKTFQGRYRPYQLQSYKTLAVYEAGPNGPGADTTFFFKRFSQPGEPAPECLKIKLHSRIGATDYSTTILRVKQLPSTSRGGLCSDSGEI